MSRTPPSRRNWGGTPRSKQDWRHSRRRSFLFRFLRGEARHLFLGIVILATLIALGTLWEQVEGRLKFSPVPKSRVQEDDASPSPLRAYGAIARTSFGTCGAPPHRDCIIDGDTFYLGSESIRIADIDAPETHPAHCETEARLGKAAANRLLVLINAGPFELGSVERDEDRYGRKLRVLVRDGRSLGAILVSEGLARKWTGRRLPWCE